MKYKEPEIEIILIFNEGIITTSDTTLEDINRPGGGLGDGDEIDFGGGFN